MSEDASYERERGARSHGRTSADQMRSRAPGSAVQCMLEVVSQSSAQVGFSEREEGTRRACRADSELRIPVGHIVQILGDADSNREVAKGVGYL